MINYLSKFNCLSIKLITCQNKLIADQRMIDYRGQNCHKSTTYCYYLLINNTQYFYICYDTLPSVDRDILVRASRDVSDNFPQYRLFNATWVLIVTWYNVTFYGANTSPYQVIVIIVYRPIRSRHD